ncbi:MAG TPA: asparagine synthase (glutamine-hydrolyzing) [Candidatus Acidoferrales bacterium]|nr:asparagine synthase (glutamine-hydrolyzing) [Candidatus Acidoferrales bacterium]
MSGIAGIFSRDSQPADANALKKMAAALAQRGPHGEGVWARGPVGLVHRLLSTCPEGMERQPLADRSSELCLTFDGRLDNRDEIFQQLGVAHEAWDSISDAVAVLAAYRQWGETCVEKMLGDFAFAVWDQANQKLFCARDAMGVKPFYYCLDEKKFVFASEPQAIFASGEVEHRPDLEAIAKYLTGDFGDTEQTRYAKVMRLPARYSLSVSSEAVQKRMYWDFDPSRRILCRDDAEYGAQFAEIFSRAVRSRLRSRTPIGARLSGGLDSSSVVCVASLQMESEPGLARALETFSNVFEGMACDERPFIEDVVAKAGVKANFFAFKPGPCEEPAGAAASYPDNFYHPGMLVNVPMCTAMKERGFHVAFEGIGGDELLAPGCEHVTDLAAQRKFKEAWREARRISKACDFGTFDLLYIYGLIPFVPEFAKPILRPLHRLLRGGAADNCVRGEFLKRAGVSSRHSERQNQKFATRAQQKIYDVLFRGWNALVAVEEIESFSSRFGIEVRYPFLDRRVAEFVIALPPEQRWRGQSKFILRQAMNGILPESVRTRRGKAVFSPLLHEQLSGTQGQEIRAAFANSEMASEGILDRARLMRLFDSYEKAPSLRSASQIMFLTGLELWFRQFSSGPKTPAAQQVAASIQFKPEATVLADSVN